MKVIARRLNAIEQHIASGPATEHNSQRDLAAKRAMAEMKIKLMKQSLEDNPDHGCQEAMAEQQRIIDAIDSGTYPAQPAEHLTKDERACRSIADLRRQLENDIYQPTMEL